jgi:hypothetical protein
MGANADTAAYTSGFLKAMVSAPDVGDGVCGVCACCVVRECLVGVGWCGRIDVDSPYPCPPMEWPVMDFRPGAAGSSASTSMGSSCVTYVYML